MNLLEALKESFENGGAIFSKSTTSPMSWEWRLDRHTGNKALYPAGRPNWKSPICIWDYHVYTEDYEVRECSAETT